MAKSVDNNMKMSLAAFSAQGNEKREREIAFDIPHAEKDHKRNEEQVPFAMHQRKHSDQHMHKLRPVDQCADSAA